MSSLTRVARMLAQAPAHRLFSSHPIDVFRQIDRSLDDFLRQSATTRFPSFFGPFAAQASHSAFDVTESQTAYTLVADTPGYKKADLKIELTDAGTITISGERKSMVGDADDKTKRVHHIERPFGSFARSFRLPDSADVSAVDAVMEDGVLTITVPKKKKPAAEAPRVVNIAIKDAAEPK